MKYTLTLSRWHKVAERINVALKEREANVKAAFTATAWCRRAPGVPASPRFFRLKDEHGN